MGSLRRAVIAGRRIVSSYATPYRTPIAYLSHLPNDSPFSSPSRWFSHETGIDIDLYNQENKRRLFNRLLYRSKQRGFLELDLVLGNWVEEHIYSLDQHGIRALVDVLDLENPDLWKWLTGQEQPPEAVSANPVFSAIRDNIMNNLNSYASPGTRARSLRPCSWEPVASPAIKL